MEKVGSRMDMYEILSYCVVKLFVYLGVLMMHSHSRTEWLRTLPIRKLNERKPRGKRRKGKDWMKKGGSAMRTIKP